MNSRLRKLALTLAVAAAAALGASSSASAATGMEIAIQDDPVFVSQEYFSQSKAFDLAQDLHTSWLKVNVVWAQVVRSSANRKSKPSTVAYDWSSYDQLVTAARARGINIQMSLTGNAPRWATGDKKKSGPYKPNASYFREFAAEAAAHFRGLVTRYSIWNEPNHTGWITPLKSQASVYRALYQNGSRAIKEADPTAQVLFGELAPYVSRKGVAQEPLTFLRAATKGGTLIADGFAHHPYDFLHKPTFVPKNKNSVTLAVLSRLTKELDKLARSNKLSTEDGKPLDLYLTEWGYFRAGRQKTKESTRAKYIPQGFEIAFKNKRVRQMLHYLLAQPTKKYAFFDTSIVSRSGSQTATYKAFNKWVDGRAAKGQLAGT
jgi:hypothetical protein